MELRETPGFVATLKGEPAEPSAAAGLAATLEHPVVDPRAAEPPVARVPAFPPPPAPRRAGGRRARSRRVMTRVLLAGAVAASAFYAVGAGSTLVDRLRDGASVRTVPAEGGSLLRAVALEAALQGLPPAGRVESLRVTADRLEARVSIDGYVRLVHVTDHGWVAETPTKQAPTGTSVRIDARAPARLIRAVTRRTGRSPARVSHVTLEGTRWQLVFEDGAQFSANAHGRDVRRG